MRILTHNKTVGILWQLSRKVGACQRFWVTSCHSFNNRSDLQKWGSFKREILRNSLNNWLTQTKLMDHSWLKSCGIQRKKLAVIACDLLQNILSLLSDSDEINMFRVHYLISTHSWAHQLEKMPHVSISHSSLYKHTTQDCLTLIGSTQSSHRGQFGTKNICALFICKTGILHRVGINNFH